MFSSRSILFKGGGMENLFSIGEVARYQKISKQTLIFYDKIGLFRPDYVDPGNGYRYYSAKQLDYLDAILIMKKIGFSLSEIKEHMQHYTIDSSLAAMKNQLSVIDSRIRELYMIRSRLVNRCQQMEETKGLRGKENSVFLEDINPQYILLHACRRALHSPGDQHCHKKMLCRFLPETAPRIFSMRSHRSPGTYPGRPLYRGFPCFSSHRENRQSRKYA